MRAVICDYVRTPFHRAHKGELAQVRPEDMLKATVSGIINRTNVDVNDIEDLMLGCAYPEGVQGLNLGRIATYLPGLPNTIPGMTTNRLCGSSMQVAHSAAGAISIGSGEVFLAAGVETMSLVKRGGWNRDLHPTIEAEYPDAYISMGLTAENLANDYSISRIEQEEFALRSHKKPLVLKVKGCLLTKLRQLSQLTTSLNLMVVLEILLWKRWRHYLRHLSKLVVLLLPHHLPLQMVQLVT